jgi:hypothetical protein
MNLTLKNPYWNQEPYLGQIRLKLLAQLSRRYSLTKEALGEEVFRRYAILAIQQAWPHTGNLWDYGEHLIFCLQAKGANDWCIELARLEWAMGRLPSALQASNAHPAWEEEMSILTSYYDLSLVETSRPLPRLKALMYFWCVPWWSVPVLRIKKQDAAWLKKLDGTRSIRRLYHHDRTGVAKRLLPFFLMN